LQRKDEQIKAICEAIKLSDGIDYRYDHFRQKEAVPPPFLIYRRVAGLPFSADDKTYTRTVASIWSCMLPRRKR